MKKWNLWSFVVLALGFALASSLRASGPESDLFTPAPEPKIVCEKCLGAHSTAISGGPSAWGFGTNCTNAQNDLVNQLWNQSDLGCFNLGLDGACSVTTVVTTACYWSAEHNAYQVDGYANYKCSIYIC